MLLLNLVQHVEDVEVKVKPFSIFWWQTSGITILLVLSLLLLCIWFLKSERQKDVGAKVIAYITLIWALMLAPAHMMLGQWHITYGLPLQLCDITAYIVVVSLLTRKQAIFEVAYFLAMVGGLNALLTPQFTQGTSFFFLMEFFISHCVLLLGPLYQIFVLSMKPRTWSWLKAFGWLNVIAWSVAIINWFINANYMFMCHAPTADSPFIFTKVWPWYLLGFEAVALLLIFVFYLPFYRKNNPSCEL